MVFRMRLAKNFFLSFLAAEWLPYRCCSPTAGQATVVALEFAEPVVDINNITSCKNTSSKFFRMRLAKNFFLPFLAAEWLHSRHRLATADQSLANRPPSAQSSRILWVM